MSQLFLDFHHETERLYGPRPHWLVDITSMDNCRLGLSWKPPNWYWIDNKEIVKQGPSTSTPPRQKKNFKGFSMDEDDVKH